MKEKFDVETGEIYSLDPVPSPRLPEEPSPIPVGGRGASMFGTANYDVAAVSNETALRFDGTVSMTQQQFKDECDINTIVARFGISGTFPVNPRVPEYGDFEHITDYQSALNAVMEAEDSFMEFPAALRARFDNDPQQLLLFVADPANRAEAEKLGLLKAPTPVVATPSVVQSQPPATPASSST